MRASRVRWCRSERFIISTIPLSNWFIESCIVHFPFFYFLIVSFYPIQLFHFSFIHVIFQNISSFEDDSPPFPHINFRRCQLVRTPNDKWRHGPRSTMIIFLTKSHDWPSPTPREVFLPLTVSYYHPSWNQDMVSWVLIYPHPVWTLLLLSYEFLFLSTNSHIHFRSYQMSNYPVRLNLIYHSRLAQVKSSPRSISTANLIVAELHLTKNDSWWKKKLKRK